MSIKLDQFDYDLIEQYYIKNILENDFWLFCSHGSNQEKPTSQNTNFETTSVLEKTVFGIKYENQDVTFMLQLIKWEQNNVYVQYDDRAVLKDSPFFVVVEPEIESGNYHIFKCLSNNNGAPSTEKPEFNPSIQDGLYFLSDGYLWKYMSSTPFTLFRKFAARGLIPVIRNQQVEAIANKGIYNVVVENANENSGYEKITGLVRSVGIENGITRIFLRSLFSETSRTNPIFEVPNTYSNRSIYIENANVSTGIAAIELQIRDSGVINGTPFVTVSTPIDFTIAENDDVQILPRLEIIGDGTGSTAIPIFDEEGIRISGIKMVSFGDGYSSAIARVLDPVSFDPNNVNRQDIRCLVRPILSPRNGHGSNVLQELRSKHLGLSKIITSVGGNNVPNEGTYSKFAIVKEPEFSGNFDDSTFDNRIRIELQNLPNNIQVGDSVSQGFVSGIVHEIDQETNSIFIVDYEGPYNQQFVSNEPLRFQNSNFVINSIEYSLYKQKTGTVLTITDVTPIERDEDRSEQIRLILDF